MLPLLLLVLFATLALTALAAFVVLTFLNSTPRREDWKRFLSSFAGTTLGLSVGFISFMLQQQNQSKQNILAEQHQSELKLTEENSQIRARLLYSIAQKRFELEWLADNSLGSFGHVIENTCIKDASEQQQKGNLESRNIEDDKAATQALLALFSSAAYERSTVIRIMKDTSLATRISHELLNDLINSELAAQTGIPLIAARLPELNETNEPAQYCKSARFIALYRQPIIEILVKLQLSSCAVFSLIGFPSAESMEKSSRIPALINAFQVRVDARDVFFANIQKTIGGKDNEFERCMALANMDKFFSKQTHQK